jgi:CHAT domain-containing protein
VCAGNELLGPAATFLSLGTSALVGSVVPVPDLAAAPLMTALHERLRRGVPAATALADAQAEVISDGELALTAAGAFICLGAGGLATTMPRRRAETDSASQLDSAPAALALSG